MKRNAIRENEEKKEHLEWNIQALAARKAPLN